MKIIIGNPPYQAQHGEFSYNTLDDTYVTTPAEIISFIERSVIQILDAEFSKKITDDDITMIDPFAGQGEFFCAMENLPKDLEAYELDKNRYDIMCKNFQKKNLKVKCENKDTFEL